MLKPKQLKFQKNQQHTKQLKTIKKLQSPNIITITNVTKVDIKHEATTTMEEDDVA